MRGLHSLHEVIISRLVASHCKKRSEIILIFEFNLSDWMHLLNHRLKSNFTKP